MIRVGIIGTGFGEKVHLPAFRSDKRFRIVAVASRTFSHAKNASRRHGIPRGYDDWKKIVDDPEVDAVSIAVPPRWQPTIAQTALERGKAVFCEKPMALTVREARKMLNAAKRSRLANMVDLEFSEVPAWRIARSLLRQKSLGDLRHVAVSWNVETYANRLGLRSWKSEVREGGGALGNFTSHVFYYLEWFCGPIQSLSARLARFRHAPGSSDTFNHLSLRFRSGFPGAVLVSTHAYLGSGHRVEFYGDKGTLVLENRGADYIKGFKLFFTTRDSRRLKEVKVATVRGVHDGRILAVQTLVSRFADQIERGGAASPGFREGLRVQQLIEWARESDRSRCWVVCGG